ncbi:hypothetical protein DFP73DRAFT_524076 [Morchella snyderi]|nr:hypothetical protein DFP73DRAFT_524076 [Morchella snyderi]
MLPKFILPLASLALALPAEFFPDLGLDLDPASITTTTDFHPPTGAGTSSSSSLFSLCKLAYTVTYYNTWSPIFIENRYTCDFSKSPHHTATPTSTDTPPPLHIPAPFSHPAGNHTADPRIAPAPPQPLTYAQQRTASTKRTITHYGCVPLPHRQPLPRDRHTNLFWGIQQLPNQSCLAPGEVSEFTDLQDRDWGAADWRFTSANRGHTRVCDWYTELANVARALHYFCFHTLGRPAEAEFGGGDEIIAYGRGQQEAAGDGVGMGGMRWCMRYSEKGWGLGVFEEKCLGLDG